MIFSPRKNDSLSSIGNVMRTIKVIQSEYIQHQMFTKSISHHSKQIKSGQNDYNTHTHYTIIQGKKSLNNIFIYGHKNSYKKQRSREIEIIWICIFQNRIQHHAEKTDEQDYTCSFFLRWSNIKDPIANKQNRHKPSHTTKCFNTQQIVKNILHIPHFYQMK